MTNETTALSEKKELNLSTSNTKSSDIEGIMVKPDRNINTTADQKAANFEIWNPPSQNLNSEKQLNGKQQNQEQRPIALLSDGRPVISKHEELPDYSAFEEV